MPVTERDLFSVVTRQRACRRFSAEPVDDDSLAQVLRAATFAPSAENRQPWEFVVVRDPSRREAIADLMKRAWERGGRAFSEGRLSAHTLRDVDDGMTGGFASAPVLIVVCADLERGLEQTIGSSIFPAAQNLLLAATALGLGSALTTIATTFARELATILDLPDHVRAVAVVPIGHPARPLGPPQRGAFEDHTHRETFGQPWEPPEPA
jgi:nitroreductase